ncbi:MAG: thioredoxin domain-containing protein, partial [Actinomycetota bacterium]
PVDWWPWSDEAFAEAERRGVPVLLSVGYSACHWCHVMAHESFEDGPTAALMNEQLVAIKVDREERPDVDAVYMTATQAMTGQGGWPMTVFMTPAREPFYCGTYFPREQFQRLVAGVARTWREDPANVTNQASQIAAALAERGAPFQRGSEPVAGELAAACEAAVAGLVASFDERRGGFGDAPKFPPSMVLEFLLRHHHRTAPAAPHETQEPHQTQEPQPSQAHSEALRMAVATAEAMARGGMYDQLAGGFARYSVDADWVVPHFEKMLYDNALLARAYTHLWRLTGSALARRVAEQTCAWMISELGTAEGGFASALDADSEGEEGRFYVWTPAELTAVLGPQDGPRAAEAFGVTAAGTFEHGSSVLQLRTEPEDPAWLDRARAALLAARAGRVRPGRDDKVVAAWNGMAIAALAEAGLLLDQPAFVTAALGAAKLLADVHLSGARMARTSRDGAAGTSAGVLEDYACVADGFIALSGVTGEARWTELAGQLLATAMDRFRDAEVGFYDTADDGEPLIYRPADPTDGPTPSGTFAVAGALLSYSALTGSLPHREAAQDALSSLPAIATRFPTAAGAGLAVAEAFLSGPAEIAIVGPQDDPRTAALHLTAMQSAPPGAVVVVGDPVPSSGAASSGDPVPSGGVAAGAGVTADSPAGAGIIPLLAGRTLIDGAPAAYVCRDFACRLPVTDPAQLREELSSAW